jgi:hypothetical protein
LTADEYAQWQRKEALRKKVIKVDDFPHDFGRAEASATARRARNPRRARPPEDRARCPSTSSTARARRS